MKKISIIVSLLLGISAAAMAQPRAAGLRIGATCLDVSFQYDQNRNTFLQGDLGMDFGSSKDAAVGFKFTGTYNIVWARPAWTDMGTWALYAGPGVSLGYVGDKVTYKNELTKINTRDHGFMFALAAQAGIEHGDIIFLGIGHGAAPFLSIF